MGFYGNHLVAVFLVYWIERRGSMRLVALALAVLLLLSCGVPSEVLPPLSETPVTPKPTEPKPPIKAEPPAEPPQEKPFPAITLEERLARLPEGLDKTSKGFWFRRNTTHTQPTTGLSQALIEKYDCIVLGSKEDRYVYLTFDVGYEQGFTPRILDVLKEEGVTAAFFITGLYARTQPGLVRRMAEEGHMVANHTVNHPSMPSLTLEQMKAEILGLADTIEQLTGQQNVFFRPPMGHYSDYTLAATHALGYKTVFWSMAYVDWHVNDQPGAAYALEHVTKNIHPGAVILLHAVSQSNTEALPAIIRQLKAEGYEFRSLHDFR